MVDTQQRGRIWFERDLPVLLATARLVEASRFNRCMTTELARETGFEQDAVVSSIARLKERYVHVADASTYGGRDYVVTGLTAAGLEVADVWPSSDALAERLVAALERLLQDEPEESPRRAKLQSALSSLREMGVGASGGLLAQAVGYAAGIS